VRSLLLAAVLVAAPGLAGAQPQDLRAVLSLGATPVAIAVSDDDRVVGIAGSDGSLHVIDTADFGASALESSACGAATSVAFVRVDEAPRFYLGCDDGSVVGIELDDDVYPVAEASATSIALGTGSILGIGVTDSGTLFGVEDASGESIVHSLDLATEDVDALVGFPMTSIYATESVGVTPQGSYLVMGNDQGRVTKMYNSAGTYYLSTYDLMGLGSMTDVALIDEGYAYLLESSGMLIQYYLTGDSSYLVLASELGTPAAFDAVQTADDTWFYVADDAGTLSVIPFTGGETEVEVDLGAGVSGDLAGASAADGLVYVGGADSSLFVVGAGPWVEIEDLSPAELHEGESTTLTFTVDTDCSYDIFVGGGIDMSGAHLAAHDGVAEAGQSVQVEIAGDDLDEGDNRVFVFATADGYTGRDSDTVYLDTPPDAARDFDLGFGDEKLYVQWTTNDESDIEHYVIMFADTQFDEATGAPEFQVEGSGVVHTSPVTASHDADDTAASYTLEDLLNDVEYCVAIYAVDAGGQEGPWSDTLCDSPESTVGAGDDLGYCGTCAAANRPRGAVWPLAWPLGLAAWTVLRRRRNGR
jgi:hypothetical protein